ncbi:SNF2-related protein [Neofusicoccum parvum]|uniref:SNF2-related protein n=1 Tax=Neofusicoccum parvum TaxID=310453 RepID=A0ACB5RRV6_9PEZI|nr:SNF2-related protein [Neofusicoccum parvum]
MSSLAPNASAEEVQDEIAFTIILLETLDPDSDSYWQDKVTREAELADLQSRLDALQRNMAGPSYTNGQSTRPSLFQPNGSYQQFNEPASLYPPTGTRKRPRTLEDTLAADHANKSSRTTPSPSATTPGTSSSNDSFPELFETWPPQAQAGGSSGTG